MIDHANKSVGKMATICAGNVCIQWKQQGQKNDETRLMWKAEI